MRHFRATHAAVAAGLFALATLLPAPAAAQQAVAADTVQAVATNVPAPPVSYVLRPAPQRVGVALEQARTELRDVTVQDRVRAGPDVAMMAVGGAALVAGLLIGGDSGLVLATGGAVVGLIGLYRYLR